MSADALFWIAMAILVGIYAVWWEEEREVRSRDRRRDALRPLGRPTRSN